MDQRDPSGWAIFTGLIMFIVGSFNVIYGLAAILNDPIVQNTENGVIIADFTTWGWITLLLGVGILAVAIGLWSLKGWARVGGVIFAAVSAIAQVGLITAFPLWSILIITLCILVIYNLTVRGGEAAE